LVHQVKPTYLPAALKHAFYFRAGDPDGEREIASQETG